MQDARHHKSLAILTIGTTDRHKAWAQLEPGVLGIASQNAHEARLNVSLGLETLWKSWLTRAWGLGYCYPEGA